jgi:hypothetical protein
MQCWHVHVSKGLDSTLLYNTQLNSMQPTNFSRKKPSLQSLCSASRHDTYKATQVMVMTMSMPLLSAASHLWVNVPSFSLFQ